MSGDEVRGWLLDADYVTRGGRAVIRLWVKTESGVVRVFDDSFEPYFYCLLSGGVEDAVEALEALDLRGLEGVERKLLGSPVEMVRAVVHHPQDVPELRGRARALDSVEGVREAHVPFAIRYVIDRGLVPVGLHSFDVEERGGEFFLSDSEALETEELPELSVLAFDCEMLSDGSAPDPGKDEVVVISAATAEGTELFTAEEGEDGMIQSFLEFLDGVDPDVVVTYNGDDFDWPYLRDRAEVHDVDLDVGRDGSTPVFRDGARGNVDVRGRLNVDLYRVAERDVGGLRTKSLEDVAEHLGVVDRVDRASIDSLDVRSYWEDDGRRGELLRYAEHDAESTFGIATELLPLQLQLSRLVHRFPDDVSKMGRGRQVEWFLVSEAHEAGEVVPEPSPSEDSYAGGLVLEPKKGLHDDVVCLDFSSMYPSIMIAYNISPDTLVEGKEARELEEEEFFQAPEVEHRFRREPDGFFKRVLVELIEERRRAKAQRDAVLRGGERDGEQLRGEARLTDLRQRTLKVLANSFYGYTGWPAAAWYRQECAEATAAWGRHLIQEAVEEAEERGYEVLYGDTDSLFLKGVSDGEAEAFASDLTEMLPLELEVEAFYETIFFTGVKKRYAGVTRDGRMDVKGLEVQRGDWCDLAKEIQSRVLHMLLEGRDPEGAAELVRGTVEDLRAGNVDLEKLVIRKTLTKGFGRYKSVQAHVEAAKRLAAWGRDVSPGEKVEFVVIRGGGRLSDRSYPVEMFEEYVDGHLVTDRTASKKRVLEQSFRRKAVNRAGSSGSGARTGPEGEACDSRKYELDVGYYVEKQVVPAASRILNHFGFSDGYLMGQPRQATFEAF
ncbi:MAG: DNA polymerase [Methanonatronarchaeales archaeon]|nr:DNA polymerase [Methanonatronarchaeales archaeon]